MEDDQTTQCADGFEYNPDTLSCQAVPADFGGDGVQGGCTIFDVPCHLNWLGEEIYLIFVAVYDSMLQGLASMFASIPVPDFLLSIGALSLPSYVVYLADIFAIPEGMAIMVSASIAGFLIRRIPLVG